MMKIRNKSPPSSSKNFKKGCDIMKSINKHLQNKTTPEEVVILKSNILFDTNMGFDSTLDFIPFNKF